MDALIAQRSRWASTRPVRFAMLFSKQLGNWGSEEFQTRTGYGLSEGKSLLRKLDGLAETSER